VTEILPPPTRPGQALLIQFWRENPIFRQVLGICSALAVTNLVFNTALMCAGLIWTTTMSSLTVSLLRKYTPQRIRIMIQILIVAVYVIVVDIVFRAFFFETHKDIAAYVGLIITNCIVLGRLEAFANKNRPLISAADGLGAGLGYSLILLFIAVVRELLGFGTLLKNTAWEITLLPAGTDTVWRHWTIMVMPPGAFFVLAIAVWIAQTTMDGGDAARLILVLLSAALTDNILMTRFLGMCPFLSTSRQFRPAVGMGFAVIFVTTCTCLINWALYTHLLVPLAEYGVPAESLKLILFIVVIAAFVQLMEMVIERTSVTLYYSLGIFLPLITVNCAILGASLFMVTGVTSKGFGATDALAFGFGTGLGWFVAIVILAGIRQRLKTAKIPAALEGPGITLIITGIMALAFVVFQGMIKL